MPRLKPTALLSCVLAATLAACASPRNSSELEWQRAECNRKIDREDRDRCLARVDGEDVPRAKPDPPARRY